MSASDFFFFFSSSKWWEDISSWINISSCLTGMCALCVPEVRCLDGVRGGYCWRTRMFVAIFYSQCLTSHQRDQRDTGASWTPLSVYSDSAFLFWTSWSWRLDREGGAMTESVKVCTWISWHKYHYTRYWLLNDLLKGLQWGLRPSALSTFQLNE